MVTPIDIVNVLKAAAPIAASVAALAANKEKSEKVVEEKKQSPTVNVTINNHFYTNSEEDAINAASKVNDQLMDSIISSKTRYII